MIGTMYVFRPGRTILAFRNGVDYTERMNIFLVFVGGGLGAAARYLLQGAVYRFTGAGFPYGTIVVNVLGCFVIGLLMSSMEERFLAAPPLRIFLTIGVLGGFTTFSSFSYETMALLREGDLLAGGLNIFASMVICLGATWLGLGLGRYV
jgi:fluoride exporter